MHYTEYSKVLHFFKGQVTTCPNTDLQRILQEFIRIKTSPDDLAAARYLISQFHHYNDLIAQANTYVR